MLKDMISEWSIEPERHHILVRDGAANMVLGAKLAEIESVHCFLHQLHLIIQDGIFSQKLVTDLCTKCRRINTHFNHSSLGCTELKKLQQVVGVKEPLMPIQDVKTRWNSTCLMLERMNSLKRSIQLYTANHDLPMLTSNEWQLIEKIFRVLQPFFEKKVSSQDSIISSVIPHSVALDRYLSKIGIDDDGVQTTKKELCKSLRKRILSRVGGQACGTSFNIMNNKNYVLSTFLDPRFKMKFMNKETKMQAKVWLLEEFQRLFRNETLGADVDWEGSLSSGSSASEIEPLPRNKEGNLKDNIHIEFISCYESYESDDDIDYEECKSKRKRSGPKTEDLTDEMEEFLRAPLISQDKDPSNGGPLSVQPVVTSLNLHASFCHVPLPQSIQKDYFQRQGTSLRIRGVAFFPRMVKSYYYFITT